MTDMLSAHISREQVCKGDVRKKGGEGREAVEEGVESADLEVEVKDVLDVDAAAGVIGAVGEAAGLSHEVGQGVVTVGGVPGGEYWIRLVWDNTWGREWDNT